MAIRINSVILTLVIASDFNGIPGTSCATTEDPKGLDCGAATNPETKAATGK